MSVKIVYHGHTNVEIHSGLHRIQIDPFYDQNPLADVKAAAVHPQYILLTHAHFDHEADALAIAKANNATIVSCYEIAQHYGNQGCQIYPMNLGGTASFPFGKASMTLAFHTSSFADGSNGGVAAGFVVETGDKVIYHAGDTALFGDMQLIGKLWKIDVALLPIGDGFTMGPAHALMAAEFLKAKTIIPIHYDTYPPIKQDANAFTKEVKKLGFRGFRCGPATRSK